MGRLPSPLKTQQEGQCYVHDKQKTLMFLLVIQEVSVLYTSW